MAGQRSLLWPAVSSCTTVFMGPSLSERSLRQQLQRMALALLDVLRGCGLTYMSQADLTIGYVLGSGGFGTVTAATHATRGALAIKGIALVDAQIHTSATEDEAAEYVVRLQDSTYALDGLLAEARFAGRLADCRHLTTACGIVDHDGPFSSGSVFSLALPLISGGHTLATLMADCLDVRRRIPLDLLLDIVQQILEALSCVLRPRTFFVSWQGVLTLAFRGLPPALVELKAGLEAAHDSLPRENSGSRWPKVTLGVLGDARRLLPDQLERLNALCAEEGAAFQSSAEPPVIIVDRAAVVLYECRSLERVIAQTEVRFAASVDEAEPEAAERERVERILLEAADPDYWFAASRDGNREAHYRGTHLGATLVFPLPGASPADLGPGTAATPQGPGDAAAALRQRIAAFRERVDSELPAMYCWLSDASLHVTLRALMG
ncbi:hypothetical protein WJX81_001998 [Elliptochloris bilobata]|uniref:Protein kinase domain-containing protein n=1 Tax=Elliptochloris bilobata TaxID=381761 RepID=A0AAW1QYT5_9CHLO